MIPIFSALPANWAWPRGRLGWYYAAFIVIFPLGGGLLCKLMDDGLKWWNRPISAGEPIHSPRVAAIAKWYTRIAVAIALVIFGVELWAELRG
ncbi:MAG: hypothetical protein IJ678_04420 [Kiritimatiellae bacterium]|nr:hypothetical protein [Kiritimatiellia bacterium]